MWLADIDPSALGGSSLVGVVMLALWIVYTQIKNAPVVQAAKTDTAKFEKLTMILESLVRQTAKIEEQQAASIHEESKRAAVGDLILKGMMTEQKRTNDLLERVVILLERDAAQHNTPSTTELQTYRKK